MKTYTLRNQEKIIAIRGEELLKRLIFELDHFFKTNNIFKEILDNQTHYRIIYVPTKTVMQFEFYIIEKSKDHYLLSFKCESLNERAVGSPKKN